MTESYSVLMSVYYKEKPEYLRESMNSIFEQTVPTDDFVLICDGPLDEKLDAVIFEMQSKFGERLYVHRLQKNGGLGNALNIGIKYCKNELVARMDSDDISRSNRCEAQVKVFCEHPEYSVVSGIVEEFATDKDHIQSRRILPEKNAEILEFAKKRNPFNHPCVMYKKSAVEAAGGYQDFYLLEDYYLWVRLLQKGYIGYNLQVPLLWMRAGSDLYQRRSGWDYAMSQYKLFKYMEQSHFITKRQYILQTIVRICASVVPNNVRKFFYKKVLRSLD